MVNVLKYKTSIFYQYSFNIKGCLTSISEVYYDLNMLSTLNKIKIKHIVVIGASSGGLQSLIVLFKNLSNKTNCSFIIITHILRNSISLLPLLLSRYTKMNIEQIVNNTIILPNTIYTLPSNKYLIIKKNKIDLIPRPNKEVNTAFNSFLFSMIKNKIKNSIIVILSGEGSDGAIGMKMIKENLGSINIAESLKSARSKSMPLNAILIDHIDFVLTPKNIAKKINELSS